MTSILKNLGDCLRLPLEGKRLVYTDLLDPSDPVDLTAIEFDRQVCAVARAIEERGFGKGDTIALVAGNRLETALTYFAVMRTGAAIVPVNFKLTRETIHHILKDSACKMVFVDEARKSCVPKGISIINFDDQSPSGFKSMLKPGPFKTYEPAPDDLAEILYTSGSTGMPKGVPLTHSGQCWAIEKYMMPIEAGMKQVCTPIVAPMYHMNALFFTTIALLNRMRVVSLPAFMPEQYLEVIADYGCSYITGVPSMIASAVRAKNKPALERLECVDRVHIGSSPITPAIIRQVHELFPRAAITNGYGSTEAGPAIFGPHPDGLEQPPASVGHPYSDVGWRFAGGSETEGPLELQTPALTKGYLKRPEVTAEKFGDGWYKTGDVMRRDSDGFFYFVRREDDMFVCGGENIYPAQVERLLEQHPDVLQAAVVGAPDPIKGMVPVAFIVQDPTAKFMDEEIIKSYSLANGPVYAHPRRVIFKQALPLGGTHKIDKKSLEDEAKNAQL